MPRTSHIPAVAPARPVAPPKFNLDQALRSIRFESVHNQPPPTFTYCHYIGAKGAYTREAAGHCISVCYDVFARSRSAVSRREEAALNQAMNWMGPSSTDRLGSMLLLHMIALGAVCAGVNEQVKASPGDGELAECKKNIEAAILRIGVRIGRCHSAPNGGYHGDTKSKKLTDAMKASRKCIVECAMKLGGQRLFGAIAGATLVRPMMNSMNERSPALAASIARFEGGVIHATDLLDEADAQGLERVLNLQIESGVAENLTVAVLDLLSIPESIKWGLSLPQAIRVGPSSVSN